MHLTTETILVTGATGQRGGAAVRHLLADGWRVRALVRDRSSAAARVLAHQGAELVQGDMDDRRSLDVAARGVYGIFSVQPAYTQQSCAKDELLRGLNVAEAARDADVEHFVYASAAGADSDTGIPQWDIKWQIEQRLPALGLSFTILRPVTSMERFADPTHGPIGEQWMLRTAPANRAVQLIALSDVGAYAALAFSYPEMYCDTAVELAGDELTPQQILTKIGQVLPGLGGRQTPPPVTNGNAEGEERLPLPRRRADIPALRAQYPPLMDFETWLLRGGPTRITARFDRSRSTTAAERPCAASVLP